MSVAARFALLSICAALLLSGCGDSAPDPTVKPAVDREIQIERLQRQKAKLKRSLEEDRQVAASSTPGISDLDLPGQWGVVAGALGTSGPVVVFGDLRTGEAWSTIKVPIAERVLADAGGPTGLDPATKNQIHRAITLSDNDAAADLFEGLEKSHGGLEAASRAVGEELRQAGDRHTSVSTIGRDGFSTYGQTDWSLEDQFAYLAALGAGCVSDPASRALLLDEMSEVAGSDTFGLGTSGYPAKWKGGWGPGADGRYLVRQMGLIEVNGKQVAAAIAAIPADGSFESGQAMLDQIADQIPQLADQIPASTGC